MTAHTAYIQDFIDHCRSIKSLSANTIKAYQQDLNIFGNFLNQKTSPEAVTSEKIMDFIEYLRVQRQNSPATVRRRWICLRKYYSWMAGQGFVSPSPCDNLPVRIQLPKRLPRALSEPQVSRMLMATKSSASMGGKVEPQKPSNVPLSTDLALRLMIATGIRVGELSALRLEDVSTDGERYRIRGKGSRERIVYVMNPSLQERLRSYMSARYSDGSNPSSSFFVNRNGSTLTPQTFRLRIKKLAELSQSKTRITPHSFRHTAATMLLEKGVDIRFVQKLLGHSTISTTEIYTHVSDQSLRNVLQNADPIALFG